MKAALTPVGLNELFGCLWLKPRNATCLLNRNHSTLSMQREQAPTPLDNAERGGVEANCMNETKKRCSRTPELTRPREQHPTYAAGRMMRAMLSRVGLNELLGGTANTSFNVETNDLFLFERSPPKQKINKWCVNYRVDNKHDGQSPSRAGTSACEDERPPGQYSNQRNYWSI
jgi:hypothetical protein